MRTHTLPLHRRMVGMANSSSSDDNYSRNPFYPSIPHFWISQDNQSVYLGGEGGFQMVDQGFNEGC